MPVLIRDKHLEDLIDQERVSRGDATMAKTLCDLVRERLIDLQSRELYRGQTRQGAENPADFTEPNKQLVAP